MNRSVVVFFIVLVAGPLVGGLIAGLDRILTARLQSRVGPPFYQPFLDVLKLLGKELVIINTWQAFCVFGYFSASLLSLTLFGLQSDLLLILFIQAVGAVFLVMGALCSTSPYSQVGAHRELLQILTYEPLLALIAVGIFLETGSFKISTVMAWEHPLLPKLPFLFLMLGYALTIKLRKSPFDLSTSHHAHQELVKGVMTDFSGPLLGLIEIGHWYEMILLLGLCGLFWATGPFAVVLVVVMYLAEIIIDNATARLTWRWMLGYVWVLGLALSLVNLVWLYQS
jgi:ech hydrogenase subunit B